MNTSNQNPRFQEPTRKSVVLLFTVGALMLVAPLSTVLIENSACRSNVLDCNHSDYYRYLVSAFPYVMLFGGALIAFNMKRISDYTNARAAIEDEEEEDDDGSLSSYR